MKVLCIYTGRKKMTGEFIAKTALKGAVEEGAEIELINLRDLYIKPCTNCNWCTKNRFTGGLGTCCLTGDDMPWLDEKILESDGMIVVSPCYENSPPSEIKLFMDRLGPSHDTEFMLNMHKKLISEGKPGYDERWFKIRPVAFIAHGGSEWTTMCLPVMGVIAVTLRMKIVGLKCYSWNRTLVGDDNKVNEIYEIGRNVALNCGKALEDMEYKGDSGHCPICHNNTMVLGETADEVTCAVCGMTGTVSIEEGKIKVDYEPEQYIISHMTDTGKDIHMRDISNYDPGTEEERKKNEARVAEAMKVCELTKPPRA